MTQKDLLCWEKKQRKKLKMLSASGRGQALKADKIIVVKGKLENQFLKWMDLSLIFKLLGKEKSLKAF